MQNFEEARTGKREIKCLASHEIPSQRTRIIVQMGEREENGNSHNGFIYKTLSNSYFSNIL